MQVLGLCYGKIEALIFFPFRPLFFALFPLSPAYLSEYCAESV